MVVVWKWTPIVLHFSLLLIWLRDLLRQKVLSVFKCHYHGLSHKHGERVRHKKTVLGPWCQTFLGDFNVLITHSHSSFSFHVFFFPIFWHLNHPIPTIPLQTFGSISRKCETPSVTWRAGSRGPRTTWRRSRAAWGPGPARCLTGRMVKKTPCSFWRTGRRGWRGFTVWYAPLEKRSTSCLRWLKKDFLVVLWHVKWALSFPHISSFCKVIMKSAVPDMLWIFYSDFQMC